MVRVFVLCALLALASGALMADNGAIVINSHTGICGMVGSDANGNPIGGGNGTVWTELENNNLLSLTCKGDNIINLSGKGQHFTGFLCGIVDPFGNFVLTTDSDATVSASGHATLTCRAPE